jgi:hypothetical protein
MQLAVGQNKKPLHGAPKAQGHMAINKKREREDGL